MITPNQALFIKKTLDRMQKKRVLPRQAASGRTIIHYLKNSQFEDAYTLAIDLHHSLENNPPQ